MFEIKAKGQQKYIQNYVSWCVNNAPESMKGEDLIDILSMMKDSWELHLKEMDRQSEEWFFWDMTNQQLQNQNMVMQQQFTHQCAMQCMGMF